MTASPPARPWGTAAPWDEGRPRRFRGPGRWLPLVVAVPQVLGTSVVATHEQTTGRTFDGIAFLLLLIGPVALFARKRHPVATLVAAAVSTLAYFGAGYPPGPAFLAVVVAVVNAVLLGHRRATWAALGAGYATYLVTALAVEGEVTWRDAVPPVLWGTAVYGLAELARARADRFAEVRRSRLEQSRRQASEERLRLAQELHDVLAHNVSLIHVQASTALHLIDDQPERARSALAAIKAASRETLQELRATVNALRAEGDAAPTAPTVGLDRLDGLLAQSADAGFAVDLRRHGTPRPLPPSVDLAAYRIVQESLTNARRHSGADSATVLLSYDAAGLGIDVTDTGRDAVGEVLVPGHGIRGMRERAEALGGTLEAGPAYGGGFAVRARLPVVSGSTEGDAS